MLNHSNVVFGVVQVILIVWPLAICGLSHSLHLRVILASSSPPNLFYVYSDVAVEHEAVSYFGFARRQAGAP